jgi:hypothetical protein
LPNKFYATIEGQVKGTGYYHPRILTALRDRNAEKARDLMREHVVSGAEHLIVVLEQQGVWANEEADEANSGAPKPARNSKPDTGKPESGKPKKAGPAAKTRPQRRSSALARSI